MSEYPEQLPTDSKPLDRFTFSISVAAQVKNDIEAQLNAIDERIDTIVNKVTVDGMPIMKAILQTSHDKKELKRLAKGIDRVADLIENYDQLKNRLSIIETAQTDPEWFAWTFGDFSDQVDKGLDSIFNEG